MSLQKTFWLPFLLSVFLGACQNAPDDALPDGPDGDVPPDESGNSTVSNIKHLVVIIQENHTFDSYFGLYCKAPSGSSPTCNAGPACCEGSPDKDPGTGALPIVLDDDENANFDPNHYRDCEIDAIHDGKMDQFVSSKICGNAKNFALITAEIGMPYWKLASSSALADRYFQPVVGASSSNNMYFARAGFVFPDNQYVPDSIGARCDIAANGKMEYTDKSIGDLLVTGNASWAFYMEGYQAMIDAQMMGQCPAAAADCPASLPFYPCTYDPGDIPMQYYEAFRDNPIYMRDFARLQEDLKTGKLPAVNFVKGIGYKSEHPGVGANISDGVAFVLGVIDEVQRSRYAQSTLILLVYDEGGGYFDHVAPPPANPVDGQAYGTRVPLLAIGPFARQNFVSHVTLEHSSVVKFIEWNWLSRQTGQLGTRDTAVNNLGSLLDKAATGVEVPSQ